MRFHLTQQGTTLIELTVAITIIATAAATLLGIMSAISSRSASTLAQAQATSIASGYMQEVLAKPYGPVPGGAGNRATYNDVLDYAGHNDVGARDHLNNAAAGLGSYNVAVAVANPVNIFAPGVPARRVTITVVGPGGIRSVLEGYKTNHP
jgi:MSHA pilin protein MshD